MVKVVTKSIIELINPKIKVSARDRFVVAESFKEGVAGICYVSKNIQKWFGAKVEKSVPGGTPLSWRLTQESVDGPIKTVLGEDHETFLAWLFEKIEAQADGRDGDLMVNNRRANIFYSYGRNIFARFDPGYGWNVCTYEITEPRPWGPGCLIFSRNSALVSSERLRLRRQA